MNDSSSNFDVPALRAQFLALLGEHAALYPQNVEKNFPRILAKLTENWGSSGLGTYLDSLVFNDREKRHGFPAEVATELFRLSNLHQTLNPTLPVSGTAWETTDDVELDERKRQSKGS
jgi:hypothetical protein